MWAGSLSGEREREEEEVIFLSFPSYVSMEMAGVYTILASSGALTVSRKGYDEIAGLNCGLAGVFVVTRNPKTDEIMVSTR